MFRINLPQHTASICKRLSILLILFIFFLDVKGRVIEKSYPITITIVPFAAFALFLIILAFVSKMRPRFSFRFLLLSTLWLIAAGLACESLISMSIERIHFVKYALLGFLIFFSQLNRSPLTKSAWALALGFAIGFTDESLQRFIPNRIFDPADILLNCSGVFFGVLYAVLAISEGPQRNS